MEGSAALDAFAALAQPTRLEAFRLLMAHEPEGLPAGDIARRLAIPPNTASSHLAVLARAGLIVSERRSRQIFYRAQTGTVRALVTYLVETCCGGRSELCDLLIGSSSCGPKALPAEETLMEDRVYNVLFLCTGNTARSILAEAILRQDGAPRFRAFSAGSQPKGAVNPFALQVLESYGYPTDGLRSKSWNEFAAADAPTMDFVFTVCDNAAGEACPVWPGRPMTAHWGIEDPAAAIGTDLQKEAAFVAAFRFLKNRISLFTALPLASIDRMALTNTLREIGRIDGATTRSHAEAK